MTLSSCKLWFKVYLCRHALKRDSFPSCPNCIRPIQFGWLCLTWVGMPWPLLLIQQPPPSVLPVVSSAHCIPTIQHNVASSFWTAPCPRLHASIRLCFLPSTACDAATYQGCTRIPCLHPHPWICYPVPRQVWSFLPHTFTAASSGPVLHERESEPALRFEFQGNPLSWSENSEDQSFREGHPYLKPPLTHLKTNN